MLALLSEWSSVIVLVIQCLFVWGLWALKKTFVSQAHCSSTCGAMKDRLVRAESSLEALPVPPDTNPILVALENLRGEIKAVSVKTEAQTKAIDRLEKNVDRLTEHHLRSGT